MQSVKTVTSNIKHKNICTLVPALDKRCLVGTGEVTSSQIDSYILGLKEEAAKIHIKQKMNEIRLGPLV
ncbi:TPA: hypothetical protein MW242_003313 [Acinetobacter baumannii]|nr:hypothetical protein [Acinetobacter baumannii]